MKYFSNVFRHKNIIDFVLVGQGQVVQKYWMPGCFKKLVNICDIISVEDNLILNPDYPIEGISHHKNKLNKKDS